MKTIYMIDFENTGASGLAGSRMLNEEDTIMIFFSQNCIRIDMRTLDRCNAGSIKFIEIPAGNQSLDMHISSYIGYFSHVNRKEGCKMVVISKDRGYEAVIAHWSSEKISIQSSKSIEEAITGVPAEEAAAAAKPKRKKKSSKKAEAKTGKNAEPNKAAKKELPKKSEPKPAEEPAPVTAEENAAEAEEKLQAPATEITAAEKTDEVQEAVETVDKLKDSGDKTSEEVKIPAAKPAVSPEAAQKMEKNIQIMQTLSKAGLPQKTVGEVSSICAKNYGQKNNKQLSYRAIVSNLGQKQGLEVYRLIKGIL